MSGVLETVLLFTAAGIGVLLAWIGIRVWGTGRRDYRQNARVQIPPIKAKANASAAEIANEYNAQFGITPLEPSPTSEQDVPF